MRHSTPSKDENLWEYRVVLVEAICEEEAREKAEILGKDYETTYEALKGDFVTWKFIQVDSVSEIEDEGLKDGSELFSRFMSDSTVKSLLTPFDD
ncbi:MAG: DUF4288 domain-containing protein [Nitrosopumilaceae archaeon]|nr:DUF4288 domain-containing protein [Nitrosopumilaceae archaeon]NIX61305.1 DUF4288 domain-containing protein [Nitrosopumilaceae archaeon]